jgi:uncharacterized protein
VSVVGAPALANAATYAPIDCRKATTAADVTICKTYSLGQAEARMATLFGIATALVAMGQRGNIMDQQIAWLKVREACGSKVSCLTSAYDTRIAQLAKVIDGIASRGPY